MQNTTASNRVKLAIVVFAATICTNFSLLPSGSAIAWGQASNRLEFVGLHVSLDKSTGTDDGAVLAVHFMGDTHGGLDTCG